jgi:hypothetical protein
LFNCGSGLSLNRTGSAVGVTAFGLLIETGKLVALRMGTGVDVGGICVEVGFAVAVIYIRVIFGVMRGAKRYVWRARIVGHSKVIIADRIRIDADIEKNLDANFFDRARPVN